MVALLYAPVVKLAYTQGSGPCGRKVVEVQLLSGAPSPGGIAQLAEQGTHKPWVAGSTPAPATISFRDDRVEK